MSRSWVRRVLVAAAAGAVAVAALSLAGVTGAASGAVSTAAASAELITVPVALESAAQPAAASAPMPGDPGEFDVFNNAEFQGGFANLTNATIPDLGANNLNLNDLISSAVNNSGTMMCLFPDANFMGQPIPFPPNTQLGQFDQNQNDTVSSVRPCN
jgi:Peptidase inhibitor family I36